MIKLKHWQLFCLIALPSAFISSSPLQETVRFTGFIIFLLWIYSIGIFGQKKLKILKLESKNLRLFKINVFICPLTILLVLLITYGKTESGFTPTFFIVTPFALYFIFSFFHITFFAIKTLTAIELNREVEFSDYSKNLFLMFFLLIGAWIIQPKVTKYIS